MKFLEAAKLAWTVCIVGAFALGVATLIFTVPLGTFCRVATANEVGLVEVSSQYRGYRR